MDGLLSTLSAVSVVAILVAVGYLFGRLGWMKSQHKDFLVKLLLQLCIPALFLSNVSSYFTPESFSGVYAFLKISLISMLVSMALAFATAKLLHLERKRIGSFIVMAALSNTLFVGMPICRELFGEACVKYVLSHYMMNTLCFWGLGYTLMSYYGGNAQGLPLGRRIWHTVKRIFSAPLIGLFIGLALMFARVQLPQMVASVVTHLGNCVTPVSLIYIGFILYENGLKRPDLGMILVLVFRSLVVPAIMLSLCLLFRMDTLGTYTLVLVSAMPVMTQSVVVSAAAGADEAYAMEGATLSTVLCFITIPLLMLALKQIVR